MLGADVLNEPCEGKTFKIGVDGNNSLEGREALITLTGADGTVKTVTVTQGAAEELAPVIESFRFRTAANAAKLPQDVVLEVGDGIISGRTSFVVEDKVLVTEFEFEGGGVYLGAQEVVSGETEGVQCQPGELHGAARGLIRHRRHTGRLVGGICGRCA